MQHKICICKLQTKIEAVYRNVQGMNWSVGLSMCPQPQPLQFKDKYKPIRECQNHQSVCSRSRPLLWLSLLKRAFCQPVTGRCKIGGFLKYILIINEMRDQPFTRPSLSDKNRLESYKYPTYQHYYTSKPARPGQHLSPQKLASSSDKNITDTDSDRAVAPSLPHKKSTKTSLKTQLANLKVEVQRIMERKQGILKSPIEKRLFPSLSESQLRLPASPSKQKEQFDDNQSITSEKILGQPIKKLQLKAATENYDHAKYMELENQLLKTELKNLKNKYQSKKLELSEKCEALEKKVSFLEASLFNSEKTLVAQITSLKTEIDHLEKDKLRSAEKAGDARTSPQKEDKSFKEESNEQKQQKNQEEVVKAISTQLQQEAENRFKAIVEEFQQQLAAKNLEVQEQKVKAEQLQGEIEKQKEKILSEGKFSEEPAQQLQEQLALKREQIEELRQELSELRRAEKSYLKKLQEKEHQVEELEKKNQEAREKELQINNRSLALWEEKLSGVKEEYLQELASSREQFERAASKNEELEAENQELRSKMDSQIAEKGEHSSQLVQELQDCIREQQLKAQAIEEKYIKALESTEKKYEDKCSQIHLEYQAKVLTRKETKSVKDSTSNMGHEESSPSVRKWKLEFKRLKEKYEQHLKGEGHKREENKFYYKSYREYKEKAETLAQKYESIEAKSERYLYSLANREKDLLQKQAEKRKLTAQLDQEKKKYEEEMSSLSERLKVLEEKYQDEQQRLEKEMSYRKDIEKKVFAAPVTDDVLKEAVERMKKRLVQQDEKNSKNVKDLKNKETLNIKLKQELREVMEGMEKQIREQKSQEISQLIQNYIEKEFQSFGQWKERAHSEIKILSGSRDSLINQIDQLKAKDDSKEQEISTLRNQLRSFVHSYNLKNIELSEALGERESLESSYCNQLEELKIIKESAEGMLREEILEKNEEIANLRLEAVAQNMKNYELKGHSSSFDGVLKSQIEENKKLREQINRKVEEIFRLRDNYSALRSQFQNQKAEIDILKLKSLSDLKNSEVNFQIELQKVRNQLDSSSKQWGLLEQKLKMVIEENRKKDSFIQTYIVGKKLLQSDKDIVSNFLHHYQLTLGSSDIVERLSAEAKEIQHLNNCNRLLLKELAAAKEKLIEFEAIDEERVSVYDSKLSKFSLNSSDLNEEISDSVDLERVVTRTPKASETKLKKTESLQAVL